MLNTTPTQPGTLSKEASARGWTACSVSLTVAPAPGHDQTSLKYRTKVDLYEDKQVRKLAREAAEKLGLRADLLELDLNRFTDLLEEHRDNQVKGKR